MAIVNKIIHRFIRQRDVYMDPTGELYNQIIPYNVQAYSYELKEGGDKNVPDDYIVRYVLGTGRSTYQQIASGLGKTEDGNLSPQLSKEFVINSSTQLNDIITKLIQSQVVVASYVTSDVAGNPFATKYDLDHATTWYDDGQEILPKKNDYVIVTADETHPSGTGDPQTVKYVCVGVKNDRPIWNYQYIINNGNFSPEQQAAIDSGITAEKVALYDSYAAALDQLTAHLTDYDNPHRVTAEQIGLGNVDNTSDADKPISIAAREAIDALNDKIDAHRNNTQIHVTNADKEYWNNKQNPLKMGDHIKINNDVISVEDNLADYDNSISQFVNKYTNELENYYTKDEIGGVYRYKGEVPTIADLPDGNLYAPDEYTELYYLTADQGEYIDTHYYPNQRTKIFAKYRVNDGNDYVYGNDIDHETNIVALATNTALTKSVAYFGNGQITYTQDEDIHDFIQKKSGVYLDDTNVGVYHNIEDFTTDSSLWVFRSHVADVHPLDVSIYEFQIYEDNVLLKHYIPVRRKADGVLGMYEVVSREFKENEYYPDEYEFIPGPLAGYGNQTGDMYKVLENGKFYMWYNHEWVCVSQEVKVDGVTIVKDQVTDAISTIGVKTKSNFIMYDWIGTEAEWEEGRANQSIPDEWICWITDDDDEPAGVANLAQVASTGLLEDLNDVPPLPVDKAIKNYVLIWNHYTNSFVWIEYGEQPEPPQDEYDPDTFTLTIADADWEDETLITDHIIPIYDDSEYDPTTHTLTIYDEEWFDGLLTTDDIIPVDDEEEYDPNTHTLTISDESWFNETLIVDDIIPIDDDSEYDPSTNSLTVLDAEYEDETLTTNFITPVDNQEYDPSSNSLVIENSGYANNTLITNALQPL